MPRAATAQPQSRRRSPGPSTRAWSSPRTVSSRSAATRSTYLQLSLALQEILTTLPEDWERRPVARLAAPVAPATSRRQWLDIDLVLRPAAVFLVVVHHATQWPIPGGASVLLMIVGFNLARFQSNALFAGKPGGVLRGLARNLGLYYLVLLGFFLHLGAVWWPSLFLIGMTGVGGHPVGDSFLIVYWFVEVYAQIVLLTVGLFAIAAVRERVAAQPFAWGLAFLAACLLLRPLTSVIWDAGPLNIFQTSSVIYLAAFGWCVHFADTAPRKVALTAAALVLFPLFALRQGMSPAAAWGKGAVLVLAALALLWVPKLPVPRPVAPALLYLAAASYHVYLCHNIPPHYFLHDLAVARPVQIIVHISAGVALGLAAYGCHQALLRRWRGWRAGAGRAPWLPLKTQSLR